MSENKQLWDVGVSINRLTGNPLDDTSVFNSKRAFETYVEENLESTTAYVGLIAAYKDDSDDSKYHICVIDSIGPNGTYTDITLLIDNINLSIRNITGADAGAVGSLASLSEAINTIKGSGDGSFAKADLNLLRKIVGDINLTPDADISDKTLSALKADIDEINGNDTTEGSFKKADAALVGNPGDDISINNTLTLHALKNAIAAASIIANNAMNREIGDREAADENIYKSISGNNTWTSSNHIAATHTLSTLYNLIEQLKGVHDLINSVTYYAGVFDEKPPLESLTTGLEVKDPNDNDPKFFLRPGIVITVGDKLHITVKASLDDAVADYSWQEFGAATTDDSRFLRIEGLIGTKDDTAVNNGDIWNNIKNIYSILGILTIDSDDDKFYNKIDSLDSGIDSLETSLGNAPGSDAKPDDTVWGSILSLYLLMKDGDIKITRTVYYVKRKSDDAFTDDNQQYISKVWIGDDGYSFTVKHTYNKVPAGKTSDTIEESRDNVTSIAISASDSYGKTANKTTTIILEYPVIVETYKDNIKTNISWPSSNTLSWYKTYTVELDGSDNNNIMILLHDSTSEIINVTGNGFKVEGAFKKISSVTGLTLPTGYACYTLVNNILDKTTYEFTIKKTT